MKVLTEQEKIALQERQKEEALKRMQLWQLMETPISEFKEEGKLNKSESAGILYWLDDKELKMVRAFEMDYGGLVYHVIKSYTNLGIMYTLLFISRYESEWKSDREDIKEGNPLVYVVNETFPQGSEFGFVNIQPMNGGLARTA